MAAPALIYLAVQGIIGAIKRHREKVRIKRLVKKIRKEAPMLKTLFVGGQWVNFITLAAQLLNDVTGAVPSLQSNHWVLLVQGLIAAFLPSVGGLGHKLAFGTEQK